MSKKLLKLEIEGFRSLRHIIWEPGDLNILIGPNAGGKSNFLKAVEFVSVAASGTFGDHVEQQGGAVALAWDGTARSVKFEIKMKLDIEGAAKEFSYILQLARLEQTSAFEIEGEKLSSTSTLFRRTRDGIVRTHANLDETRDKASAALRDNDRTLLSQLKMPIFSQLKMPSFEDPALIACGEYLSDWRSYQDFHTDSNAEVRRSAVPRNTRKIDPDGQNLVNVLNTLYSEGGRFKEDIDDAMNAAFPGQYEQLEFPRDGADQRIHLKVRWKGLKRLMPTADLSDGTLRFLYLLAILANPSPPPLIAIDEPEAGLHPSMLPIVAEFAAETAARTQVIFTTHSAEFLDAFRIVSLAPRIGVVESHDGETEIKTIGDEHLDHWLKNFTLGELYRSNGLETML